MGHPIPEVFVIGCDEYLAFPCEAPPCFGVLDAIKVTLEAGTEFVCFLYFRAVTGAPGASRSFGETFFFLLFAFLAAQDLSGTAVHECVAVGVSETYSTFLDPA
jgi:hypothetical protein